jgi:hypothetical protein
MGLLWLWLGCLVLTWCDLSVDLACRDLMSALCVLW